MPEPEGQTQVPINAPSLNGPTIVAPGSHLDGMPTGPSVQANIPLTPQANSAAPAVPEPGRRRRRSTADLPGGVQVAATAEILPAGDNHPAFTPSQSPAPTSPTAIDPNAKPKFWVSVGATVNIENYENMKLDMGVSGIDFDASPEDIEFIMGAADRPIHEVIEGLMNKVIDKARDIKIARGLMEPD